MKIEKKEKKLRAFLKPVNVLAIWALAMVCGLAIQSIAFSMNRDIPLLSSVTSIPMKSHQPPTSETPQTAVFSNLKEALSNLSLEGIEVVESPDESDQSQGRWVTVRMRVTAYCPCSKCCGRFSDGKTANGHRIGWGDRFVAAPKYIPFGTEMIIPGYNHGKAVKVADRGRVINGNRLDVFYNTHYTAHRWGTQYLDVKIKY